MESIGSALENSPVRFRSGSLTLSSKKFGILQYYLCCDLESRFMRKAVITRITWRCYHISWYRTKKAQMMALTDLSTRYRASWKFIPFTNDFKTDPRDIYGITLYEDNY